jgi:uncharacterized protein YggE
VYPFIRRATLTVALFTMIHLSYMQNTYDYKKVTFITASVALVMVALLAFVMSASAWKEMKRGGAPAASISVSGEGEVTAAPDIATITFTVREVAKTVPEAQKATEAKVTAALAVLKKLDIDDKDQKTISYTVNPRYESGVSYCMATICPPVKTIITGYEVSNMIQVKVRNVDQAGTVLGELGAVNITETSGPEFTIDDMEKVQAEAKEKAIKQAREKAEATAKSLGVSLGEIVQYSENNNGGYYPMMAYSARDMAGNGAKLESVSVPQGESVIKSNVTITFSIN